MRKLLLSLLFLLGACSNTPTNSLPPEQCRFVERVQLDPPGTYHVHETYPNITCEKNQFGHINFITNMPVGWISPDSDAGNQTNWETFLVINDRAISTAFHRGMYAGLSFPQSVDG